ncbi:MAG: histidine--tRNA ligase [Candidatus Spechtbacteria bacterium RIFCSPLOWO2_01_FULL_46_10]|uniref:Histidine--tRNA ligase n=1 Tax=Candidatus Spechtbacteria bacterium RIFCSPLOWO2_01_FULL_46_10 TaxID=1802163 RepID=A0A1G2HHQ1_9BACT|nr:MAG: histidine--tRNA ligase [Candidatus Spechtbacteria bacterium RIFCSPLOWO2_01_FULL_46_10]
MAKQTFQTPPGMHDILPDEQLLWERFRITAASVAEFYGFARIDTPILEFSDLFKKGTGEETDIVAKEMFSLKTRGGDELTLRPEGTPPVVRAFLQHGMEKWSSPVKLYYDGPMFRHEKPQRGRFRQLHQFGLEVIGEDDPVRDVQIIRAITVILEKLKVSKFRLEINTIGCSECRPRFLRQFKDYYRGRLRGLCADCRERYKTNPMRILDCDDEKCQRVKIHAPQVIDNICEKCHNHFQSVLELLDTLCVPYLLNPHLVRGLDYYTKTVFEIFEGDIDEGATDENGKKRLAIASGGRYDNLVKLLGGRPTPAVGGAIGMERTLKIVSESVKDAKTSAGPAVSLIQVGMNAKKKTLCIMEDFREAGIAVHEAFGRGSLTAQLKAANKAEVYLTVIVGQQEVRDNVAIIREMDTGNQETIPQEKLIQEIKKRLKKKAAHRTP